MLNSTTKKELIFIIKQFYKITLGNLVKDK